MHPRYHIDRTDGIITPALVLFAEIIDENLAKMIDIAGDPSRLRPHCKTHKTRELIQRQLELGIVKHKCATFAEAEMLAQAGARDIVLAFNLVGPNVGRAVRFLEMYPDVAFGVTADHPAPLAALGQAMNDTGHTIEVLLDIDTGQERTGVQVGPEATRLYRQIVEISGLIPGGLHVYDGQQHQHSLGERARAVHHEWTNVVAFRDDLVAHDWPVPRIVAGGTPTFPVYAEMQDPRIELSPGTCVLHDAGYGGMFPDLPFTPAALLLTRVISLPGNSRVTLDLGYKAVASDPPAGNRLFFPDLPDAQQVLQNEEHLVLETTNADDFAPGDTLLAIPRHICPTSALHKQVFVISNGALTEQWEIASRDRWLNF